MYRYAIVACNNCRKSKAACSGEPNCPRCKWKGLDCIFDERSILKRERLSKVITNITTSKDRFRRPYVSTACNPCARAKVKCSGGIPCDRCSKRVHRECIYINKSGNIRNKKFDESLDFDESLAICSLCSKSGNFSNEYYQCEICINEFGLESLKKFKNHKGVVQIYGITRDPFDKSYLMVMKYVSGGNLYEYLKRSYKRLNWKNKIVLLQDIAKSNSVVTYYQWKKSENMQFEEAESIRKKIIKSYNYQKALNPIHSEAIYTSRPLNNMIQESISCRRSYSYFEQYSEQSKFDIMANK
ncbi:6437_t:CDS:2 [Dentiscutata erythropus]|uniref:6437_t:CDS:1 n=1 Tax=Dentiscutata erythropus TaxID=1348616 RepID=A0A9N9J284_9GLOM|nr:6437_t:CDS:2 [Dentiscutata erythropus]